LASCSKASGLRFSATGRVSGYGISMTLIGLSPFHHPKLSLSYHFIMRACHHEIVPGNPWSIFQLQHALWLRVMTEQIEHDIKVKTKKSRRVA
jgi:hypothetical protein